MNFEEAKSRGDYKFILNGIENFIEDIRRGSLDGFYENGNGCRGAAVMEVGFVDLEVNLFSAAQVKKDANADDMTPVIDYFCCVKKADLTWESLGYLEASVSVDWHADNWAELLEEDMFRKLDAFVSEKELSFDNPNSASCA